jgi:hypothetical protein
MRHVVLLQGKGRPERLNDGPAPGIAASGTPARDGRHAPKAVDALRLQRGAREKSDGLRGNGNTDVPPLERRLMRAVNG